MPYTVRDPQSRHSARIAITKHDYKYPSRLNLTPGSELHTRIVDEVMNRAQESRSVVRNRETQWNKLEHSLTAYVPTDEYERKVKAADSRKPVSIVVPVTYAALETLLTYFVQRYFVNPLFAYEGTGPEDELGAMMLQEVINLQCRRNKVQLALHTMWRDAFIYGFGVVATTWKAEYGKRTMMSQEQAYDLFGVPYAAGPRERVTIDALLNEGNELLNVDPYRYLPDPNVPITDPQRGEYVGWVTTDSYVSLLGREQQSGGDIFNVKYLEGCYYKSSLFPKDNSQRDRHTPNSPSSSTTPIDVVRMYVHLIPAQWGLGKSEYPEKWLFAVAAEDTVIECRPLGLDHNQYPVCVCAPDADGYSVMPTSKLEVSYGLQEAMDWMLSTHIKNVRKALNDMFIVDPLRVNMQDLKNPGEGKLIRLRQGSWGSGVEGAIKQFPVVDVTQQHIQNMPFLLDLLQRVTGTVDVLQGIMRTGGERRSATESRDAKTGAVSRLEKNAQIVSLQAHYDIQRQLAFNTQQFMERGQYIKLTGRMEELLAQEFMVNPANGYQAGQYSYYVTPDRLLVDYDVIPSDNPAGGDSQLYIQLLQTAAASPELAIKTDMWRLFLYAARSGGAKNFQEFQRKGLPAMQSQVMGQQQIDQQAQAGNIVPITEATSAPF